MRGAQQKAPARYCIELTEVSRDYGSGAGRVLALDRLSVALRSGTFTAVMGPSGSGKSTLLQCAAGLDRPTSGRVSLGGTPIDGLREPAMTELRRERVGFVFQSYNLVGSLTVQANITLPLRLAGRRPDREWLREVIDRTGLADRLRHRPSQLSGGQQQRVAIARALVSRPAVLFADEPTGALDAAAGADVLALLRAAADDVGQSVVLVTHDAKAASVADSVLFLADGRLVDELHRPTDAQVTQRMEQLRRVAP